MVLAAQPLEGQATPGLESVDRHTGRVVVVDVSGQRLRGPLVNATSSEITVVVDGVVRAIGVDDVTSVAVIGDRIWDGVLKGTGIGALLTLLGQADTPSCDKPCFREGALSRVLGIAMVAAVGGWIDARHSRERVVYTRP